MTVNPNSYPGINATIVGHAAAAPEFPPYDKAGERGFKQVRIGVSQGFKDKQTNEWVEKPTLWITHSGPQDLLDGLGIGKGDKVRIDEARLEAREFERKDGSVGQAFETRYGDVTVLESKSGGAPAQPYNDATPF